jgi:hypothetical protein
MEQGAIFIKNIPLDAKELEVQDAINRICNEIKCIKSFHMYAQTVYNVARVCLTEKEFGKFFVIYLIFL